MSWQVMWSDGTSTLLIKGGFATRKEAWEAAAADFYSGLDRLSEVLRGDKVERNEKKGYLNFISAGEIAFQTWIEESDPA